LAAATGAFAQSTVTLYGQADAAYTSAKSGPNSMTGLLGAGRGSNFVGFMGSEDLGGGWKANFKLEAGYFLDNGTGAASNTNNQSNGGFTTQSGGSTTATINSATGAVTTQDRASMGGGQGLTFNRWSYAGLSNAAIGEFRVGREYTPTFQAVLAADTTGANGVQNTLFQTLMLGQANSHANATSASNGISYESPRMSGFGVKVQAFFGENTQPVANANLMTGKSGDGSSYHASYVQGPISAGFGAQTTKGTNIAASAGVGQIPGKYDVSTAYGRYDFGFAIAALAQVTEKMALSTGANENKSTVLGLRVPMGATTLNATYTNSKLTVAGTEAGKATQIGLQALYAMSKRTDLYVNYAVTDNGNNSKTYGIGNGAGRVVAVANNGDKSTGIQIGMRHNF
jgi:predicted porin